MLVKSTACRTRHCFTMRGIDHQSRHKTKTTRWVDFYFVVFVPGVPRHIKCLRGSRDDLTARCWSNLLLVEPDIVLQCVVSPIKPGTKQKPPAGWIFILWSSFLGSLGIKCLRGNRDDLTARCWSNLLLVEPDIVSQCVVSPINPGTKQKPPAGWIFILWSE